MNKTLIGVGLLTGLLACKVDTLAPLPIAITLSLDRNTIAVGDSLTLNIDAQGGNLRGIDVDFGDGQTRSVAAVGARTARITLRHAYSAAGQYTTNATVSDFEQGTKLASASVRVQ
jgi:hypothetical protein